MVPNTRPLAVYIPPGRPSPMPSLNLDYDGSVPADLLDQLELHGRRLGVPLGVLEEVGNDLDLAEAFILAVERGRGRAFAQRLQGLEPPYRADPAGERVVEERSTGEHLADLLRAQR